jgi:cytoskeleton protein RodZ
VATDVTSDLRSGIGARLRAGRERSGLSLLQAAEKLHVDAPVLEALEAERFGELGATVYIRGHMRRYAELVRESPLELQALYAAGTAVAAPDLTRVPSVAGDPRRPLIAGVIVVIAVGIIGSVWWIIENYRPPLAAPIAAAPTQGEPSPPKPAIVSASAAVPIPATVSAPPASTVAQPAAPSAAAPAVSAPQATEEPDHRTVAVTLHFTADSWAEVYDAHGERLFYDIGSADSVRTLSGAPPLRVVLGNAPGVGLEVNGHAIPVPSGDAHDGSAQFQVNRSGHVVPSRLAATDGQRR